MKIYLGILFFRLSLRCRVLWIDCVLVAFILQHNILCLYISIYVQYWYFKNKIGYPFLPLGYQTQKRKSPVKGLATIGGVLHFLLGFLFAVSSRKRKKITRPHHQNGYSLILPVTVPYPLLSSDLSFSRLDKVSYIYVPLCFPQTYPYCINHHSGLVIFETSNAG